MWLGHDVPSTSLNTTAQIATASSSWWVGPRGDVAEPGPGRGRLTATDPSSGHVALQGRASVLPCRPPCPFQCESDANGPVGSLRKIMVQPQIAVTSSTAWHKRSDPTTAAAISSHMTLGW